MSLEGQVVIITGASTGIGSHTALHLASSKAKLALVARSQDKLKEVKEQCVAKGSKESDVLVVVASVGSEEDIKRIVQATVDHFGRLDHLINNAATLVLEDVQHSTMESFDTVIANNLRAPMFLAKEAIPHLKKTKGSIINISSVNSELAEYRCAAYCISKAALEHLTRVTALEVASDKIRVNAVVLGFVVTNTMLHNFPDDMKAEMEEKISAYGVKQQPLGGGLRMSQVAGVIHFLLGDAASAITGECIRVDNGLHVSLERNAGSHMKENSGLHNAIPSQERLKKHEENKPEA